MDLPTRISEAMKQAMRAKQAERLSTLRLIRAAMNERDIALRGQGGDAVSEDDILALLGKMVKQRQESAKAYQQGGRPELAAKELAEITVIEEFLPQKLSEEEAAQAVQAAIAEAGAESLRDMGKVMGLLKRDYMGRMDFAKVGPMVKALLG
ncbi:MAG: glutamyl-tRNA amidotransferase [Rhodobacterales bacterium]|nr:MAG: glutamyl-tRNA amidotransferase [Rhodobacterales bacterium]